jgi:hypothetical protein
VPPEGRVGHGVETCAKFDHKTVDFQPLLKWIEVRLRLQVAYGELLGVFSAPHEAADAIDKKKVNHPLHAHNNIERDFRFACPNVGPKEK